VHGYRLAEIGYPEALQLGPYDLDPVEGALAQSPCRGDPGGRDGPRSISYEVGRDRVECDRIGGSEHEADMPRQARTWSFPLHGHHGVHDREPGPQFAIERGEHLGEVLPARIGTVALGLSLSGEAAVEVLHGAREESEGMGLELGKVNNQVGVEHRYGDVHGRGMGFREVNPSTRTSLEVHDLTPRTPGRLGHSRDLQSALGHLRIATSCTVSHEHPAPGVRCQTDNRFHDRRMGRRSTPGWVWLD
jgi:hypothetical protein